MIATFVITDKDINIYFNRHTPEEFEQLLKAGNPESVEQSDSLNKRKQTLYIQEEHGFTVGYAKRQYQVKGIQRGNTQLKATIKVSEDGYFWTLCKKVYEFVRSNWIRSKKTGRRFFTTK